ncbi:TPR repeat-containing protein [Cryptosporidium andersoni]|uniref:protein O-GlcNAc transferase n=1 Tax=Cryptosporidium andersoni TaxID=117008 RepID=A0A1J4MB70_9CRYT|nr:TPR repeat-containing protein [Cryptosporidium andersoni]
MSRYKGFSTSECKLLGNCIPVICCKSTHSEIQSAEEILQSNGVWSYSLRRCDIERIITSIGKILMTSRYTNRAVMSSLLFCSECRKESRANFNEEYATDMSPIQSKELCLFSISRLCEVLSTAIFRMIKDVYNISSKERQILHESIFWIEYCISTNKILIEQNSGYNFVSTKPSDELIIRLYIRYGILNILSGLNDVAFEALSYISKIYPRESSLLRELQNSIIEIFYNGVKPIELTKLEKSTSSNEDLNSLFSKLWPLYSKVIYCFSLSILSIEIKNMNCNPPSRLTLNLPSLLYQIGKKLLLESERIDYTNPISENCYLLSRIFNEIEGNTAESIRYIEKALSRLPFNDKLRSYYGFLMISKATEIQCGNGDLLIAKKILKKALLYIPYSSTAYNDLGIIYYRLGRTDKALWCFELAIKFDDRNVNIYYNLGVLLYNLGNIHGSILCYEKLLNINPNCVISLNNLATLHCILGNFDKSMISFNRQIKLSYQVPDLYNNLGVLYRDCGNFVMARYAFLKCLKLDSKYQIAAQNALYILNYFMPNSNCENEQGSDDENNPFDFISTDHDMPLPSPWLVNYPYSGSLFNNMFMKLSYIERCYISPDKLYNESLKWGNKLIDEYDAIKNKLDQLVQCTNLPKVEVNYNKTDLSISESINIGFVGAEFCHHAVSSFAFSPITHLTMLNKHTELGRNNKFNVYGYKEPEDRIKSKETITDHERVKIYIYDNSPYHDYVTRFYKNYIDKENWRCIRNKCLMDTSLMIRNDKIHVLIDLSGHTVNNCLNVFAVRNAPIQMTWIGYPNTTGLRYIDYRISDKIVDPVDSPQKYTEKVIYMPDCFLCYTPPLTEFPSIRNLPYLKNGYITFGSFNRIAKIHPKTFKTWGKILSSIPDSRLILKSKAFASPQCREYYLNIFYSFYKISSERLILLPLKDSYYEHLDEYNDIDISLDTFPYAGTTTTCECLLMGVPLITLATCHMNTTENDNKESQIFSIHAWNVGKSILTNLGTLDLIATSYDQYINISILLSKDINKLLYYRQNLRSMLLNSKLCNAKLFASNFLNLIKSTILNHNDH